MTCERNLDLDLNNMTEKMRVFSLDQDFKSWSFRAFVDWLIDWLIELSIETLIYPLTVNIGGS
jgi:hypothetical protein